MHAVLEDGAGGERSKKLQREVWMNLLEMVGVTLAGGAGGIGHGTVC